VNIGETYCISGQITLGQCVLRCSLVPENYSATSTNEGVESYHVIGIRLVRNQGSATRLTPWRSEVYTWLPFSYLMPFTNELSALEPSASLSASDASIPANHRTFDLFLATIACSIDILASTFSNADPFKGWKMRAIVANVASVSKEIAPCYEDASHILMSSEIKGPLTLLS
jgi:hypothetical protein